MTINTKRRYIIVLSLIFLLLTPSQLFANDPNAQIIALMNQARQDAGLVPLVSNGLLTNAAQGHSNYMASVPILSHTGAGNSSMSQRVTATGYNWNTVGENVLYRWDTNASGAYGQWWNSAGHKANMMNPNFREVGVAYALGIDGNYYFTMVLARDPNFSPPATEPPATEPPATEPPVTEPPVTEPPATEPPATEPLIVVTPEATEPPIVVTPEATPLGLELPDETDENNDVPSDTPQEDTPQEDTPQEDTPQEDAPQEDAPQEDAPQEDAQLLFNLAPELIEVLPPEVVESLNELTEVLNDLFSQFTSPTPVPTPVPDSSSNENEDVEVARDAVENVGLDFTDDAFVFINTSDRSLDLSGLIFTSGAGQMDSSVWQTSLTEIPVGACIQVSRDDGEVTLPEGCETVFASVIVDDLFAFWRDDFTINYNAEPLMTCSTDTGDCDMSEVEEIEPTPTPEPTEELGIIALNSES